jgi:hypothetical protein
MTDSSLKAGGLSISHITIERSMRKMHDLQKSIHLTYRTPMHVDELRMLDDTPVAASMASSWSSFENRHQLQLGRGRCDGAVGAPLT